ncbi:aldo/keto reductase [Vagococcus sp. BWB3-3]|uniref:Aldo/keto reductase n=1 Tax=Vagococcus allomyrinae TaxID=2794353 RepID=A0A940PEU4_9ENTE|nr:aldo/keto reductase [Vagococcus allomyrinae]MBP1042231.1 aldo/keto reductase [Vagococcus allomyrinae]
MTGKFHQEPALLDTLFFLRKHQYRLSTSTLKKTEALINGLTDIGHLYEKSPSQVALNWLINFNGPMIFAIPGASKLQHVRENVESMTFKLTQEELDLLAELAQEI